MGRQDDVLTRGNELHGGRAPASTREPSAVVERRGRVVFDEVGGRDRVLQALAAHGTGADLDRPAADLHRAAGIAAEHGAPAARLQRPRPREQPAADLDDPDPEEAVLVVAGADAEI